MMKLFTIVMTGVVLVGLTSLALANPSMLPKHPGYPSKGEFANDTGQHNLTHSQSLIDAAVSGSVNMTQALEDPNNTRIIKSQGAGRLPIVDGPNITIEPPVKEGTRMRSK